MISKLKELSNILGKTTKDGFVIDSLKLSDHTSNNSYMLYVHMYDKHIHSSKYTKRIDFSLSVEEILKQIDI